MGLFDLLKHLPLTTGGSWTRPLSSPIKSPIDNLIESAIDNIIKDKVTPAIGSIVYCDLLFGNAEHSGVYVGDGQIVHLSGDGAIEVVDATRFMDRLGGLNSAISIYVSCKDGAAVGSISAAGRARRLIGTGREYNLLFDNCHQFTSGCLSGNFDNPSNFLYFLKNDAKNYLGCNEWRVWDL